MYGYSMSACGVQRMVTRRGSNGVLPTDAQTSAAYMSKPRVCSITEGSVTPSCKTRIALISNLSQSVERINLRNVCLTLNSNVRVQGRRVITSLIRSPNSSRSDSQRSSGMQRMRGPMSGIDRHKTSRVISEMSRLVRASEVRVALSHCPHIKLTSSVHERT